jgi:TetR/AcrR family transcriptional repressor of mexJK operon
MALFQRDGFARTSVDAVAAEAGVSKRTVYDYYGDKARLFTEVVQATMAAQQARFQDMLERHLPADATDLEAALNAFGVQFAFGVAQGQERSAMARLIVSEASHFPELIERWRSVGPQQQALADRLAGYARRGLLQVPDPRQAAAYLGILITAEANARTLYGTVPIPTKELERLVAGGVDVFLRAFGPGSATRARRPSRSPRRAGR